MRRVYLPELRTGLIGVEPTQGHHLRNVLRLTVGETVEAFDAVGRNAHAIVRAISPTVLLQIDQTRAPSSVTRPITVASAVPKGDRADWMVEKLSELGVARFIPLRTARSVVHPEGAGKLDRWKRIAVEAAKQSRRSGLMTIEPLTDVRALLPTLSGGTYFSTRPDAPVLLHASFGVTQAGCLLIGPEGGWTPEEEAAFEAARLTAAGLGPTILRIETAAVLAAGVISLSTIPTL